MQVFIKPLDGRKVRNPDNSFAHLPDAGDYVVRSPYWLRKIREGAVEIVDMSKPPKAQEPAQTSEYKTASKKKKD